MESHSPKPPEPSSGQPGTRCILSPTRSPLPTQPARRTLHPTEPPAGGAKGPAAAGCGPMERWSANIPGSFPRRASSSQSAPPPPPRPASSPHPANRDPRFTRREAGGILGIKGARERVGCARKHVDHQEASQVPVFLHLTRRMH